MLSLIKEWVLGLAGAAVFCAVMTEITPKGAAKGVVKAVCGMVMAIALVSPLLNMDFEAYSLNLAKYRTEAAAAVERGKEISDSLNRSIIEEEYRAYILDKALSLGAELSDARVTVKWSGEGYWYPVECAFTGQYSEGLAVAVETELGVSRERQIWLSDENA